MTRPRWLCLGRVTEVADGVTSPHPGLSSQMLVTKVLQMSLPSSPWPCPWCRPNSSAGTGSWWCWDRKLNREFLGKSPENRQHCMTLSMARTFTRCWTFWYIDIVYHRVWYYPYPGDETKVTESGSSHSTPPLVQFDNFHDHDNASQLDSTESKEAESIPNLKQLTFVKA